MKMKCIITILLVTCIMTGCAKNTEVEDSKAETYTPVMVTEVAKGDIEIVSVYSGQVEPIKEVDVSGKIAGEIDAVYFNIGDQVSEGDALFAFDKANVESNVKALKSQVDSAGASVDSARLNVNITSGSREMQQLSQMTSNLKSTKISYDNALSNYTKIKSLFGEGVVSQLEMDNVEQAYLQAKNAYETMEENYKLLTEKQLGESIDLAHMQLSQAKASQNALITQYENALTTLEDVTVKSPLTGIVAAKNIEAGEMYGGGFPAYTIIDIDTLSITINVTESTIATIQLEDQVDVFFKALGKSYKGKVYEISPIPNERTLTYPVKITIQNSNHEIKSGMFGQVNVVKNAKNNVVVVNRNDLEFSKDEWSAYVVEEEHVRIIPITVGLDNGETIEVVEGLNEGMQLITLGREYVVDQERVTIRE